MIDGYTPESSLEALRVALAAQTSLSARWAIHLLSHVREEGECWASDFRAPVVPVPVELRPLFPRPSTKGTQPHRALRFLLEGPATLNSSWRRNCGTLSCIRPTHRRFWSVNVPSSERRGPSEPSPFRPPRSQRRGRGSVPRSRKPVAPETSTALDLVRCARALEAMGLNAVATLVQAGFIVKNQEAQ